MRAFKAVFSFELTNYLKSKPFLIISCVFVVLAVIATFVPQIVSVFTGVIKPSSEAPKVLIYAQDEEAIEALKNAYRDYEWVVAGGIADIEQGVADETYEFGYAFTETGYTLYRQGSATFSAPLQNMDTVLKQAALKSALTSEGVYSQRIADIMESELTVDFVTVGKDALQSFGFAYMLLFLLYLSTVMYSQYVLTSVVTEKSSKMMELLVTSTKSTTLMFGKVLGTGTAGLLQLLLILLSIYTGFTVNKGAWVAFSPEIAAMLSMSVNVALIPLAVVFFLLGFFLYAFMFAAMGSTVSRMEDANTAIKMPMLLFVGAFMISIYGMMDVSSMWVYVCSFIPFFSPMVMFMRVCMSDVPVMEVVISIALTAATVAVSGIFAARIYRTGVMLYGNRPKMRNIIKYMLNKD